MCALSGPSQLMREKEIAIPAFREHLYGTEIVTVRHFFFALKSPCGASKPNPAYHLFQTVLARVRLSASVILASRYPLSISAGVSERPRSFMVSKME